MTEKESLHSVLLEAEDCNDKNWTPILKILSENGYGVSYGAGDWMTIYKKEKNENYISKTHRRRPERN